MVIPSEYRAMLGGEARPVDVAAIEQELGRLWNAAREDTPDGQPLARACVLNLIAYVTGQEDADRVSRVIAQTALRHPSRAVVVVGEPGGDSRLDASIAAHCQLAPAGGRRVCAEQITLRAAGAALEEVHGSVLPLLVSDLPVFFWWRDLPDPYSHVLHELLESCDRLIVDSADFPPERAAAALTDLRRLSETHEVGLSDLNWARLTHWRELIAQFFDGPSGRRYLDRVYRVSVEIASLHGREADLTEGLLLVGWLASRLGWRIPGGRPTTGGGPLEFQLMGRAARVAVDLKPDPKHPGEGLQSIRLHASGGATFHVSRTTDEEDCVIAAAEMPDGSHSRVVRMEPQPDAALLGEELDMLEQDPVFEDALAEAVRYMNGSS